jgi:hypothetical protein
MTFGIYYDDAIRISAFGPCIGDQNDGAIEIQGAGWPASGAGTAMVFQNTQTSPLVECYWFFGYTYVCPGLFRLGPHPDPILGGKFADDSVPSLQDDIAGYGTLGFETAGQTACPDPVSCQGGPVLGACCYPDGTCQYLPQDYCPPPANWREGVPCEPDNPCPQPHNMGACCTDPDGDGYPQVCTITTEAGCEGQGGIYLGDGIECDPNPCPAPSVPVTKSTWGRIKHLYR